MRIERDLVANVDHVAAQGHLEYPPPRMGQRTGVAAADEVGAALATLAAHRLSAPASCLMRRDHKPAAVIDCDGCKGQHARRAPRFATTTQPHQFWQTLQLRKFHPIVRRWPRAHLSALPCEQLCYHATEATQPEVDWTSSALPTQCSTVGHAAHSESWLLLLAPPHPHLTSWTPSEPPAEQRWPPHPTFV